MNRAFVVVVIGSLAACGNDQVADDMPAIDAPGTPADAPEQVTDISANITTDTTLSGLIKIHNTISIPAGVTVTVMPHSRIQIGQVADIQIAGTLTIAGTKDGPVYIEPLDSQVNWDAFELTTTTGMLDMTYVIQTGGGIYISNGHVKARDSQFSRVTHDLLVVSGGANVDFQYSWIGQPIGTSDTTHCDMHIEGGTPTVVVSHSNISTSAYGVMFYAGASVDFTYNNWFSNALDIDRHPPASGDVSHGWFKAGNPALTGVTANNMATGQITDAGPR